MRNIHITLVLFGILLTSCNMEELKWKKAIKKNTIAEYSSFRDKYPDSKYDSIAFDKIINLGWDMLQESDSIEQFIYFQKHYPTNKYSDTIAALAEKAKMNSYTKAIKLGDKDRIQSIINYDTSLIKKENLLMSAIMLSVDNCQPEILKFFKQYISDLDVNLIDGSSLLHHAAKSGCVAITNYLIANGMNVNKMVEEVNYLRGFQMTSSGLQSFGFGKQANEPDLYGSPLHWAAKFNQLEIAKILIENGADVNKETNRDYSILIQACETGNSKLVELLLSHGSKWHYDNEIYTQPIHHAKTGDIAKMLIEEGESINTYCKQYGMPVHYAAYSGFTNAIKFYLQEGVDINQEARLYVSPFKGYQTITPIWLAAYNGDVKTIKLLQSMGGNIDYSAHSEFFNGSLLHAAAINRDSSVMEYLTSQIKNIEIKTDFEKLIYIGGAYNDRSIPSGGSLWNAMTPLGLSAYFGNLEAAKVLVKKGANTNYRNPQGWAILDFAIVTGRNAEMVKYLLKNGAKRYETDFEIERINTSDEIIQILKEND